MYFGQKRIKWSVWCSQPVLAVFLMSFASGLPLILVGSTLQAWYTVSGVSLLTIGMLTLIGQPYVYKFLWAPLMDRFAPLKMDRRRGWIALTQIFLILGLVCMAMLSPSTYPGWLAFVALVVAFISASQDIAIDAYRVDILDAKTRSVGSAVTNFGSRMATVVGGAFALMMAAYWGWSTTYCIMAGLIFLELLVTYWVPRPVLLFQPPDSLRAMLRESIRNVILRKHAMAIMCFIIIYKIGDALAFALNTTFLIRGIGFSLTEIALTYKITSLIALLLGSFAGGALMQSWGTYRSLLYFGLLQTCAHLAFVALALVGKNMGLMVFSVFIDYFCSGLGTVAFVVFLMSLCDKRYSASQYALFSALMAISRVFSGPEVAILVDHFGWAVFYGLVFLSGFPALFLLCWLKTRINFNAPQKVGVFEE